MRRHLSKPQRPLNAYAGPSLKLTERSALSSVPLQCKNRTTPKFRALAPVQRVHRENRRHHPALYEVTAPAAGPGVASHYSCHSRVLAAAAKAVLGIVVIMNADEHKILLIFAPPM
jgi:hypothetical protein